MASLRFYLQLAGGFSGSFEFPDSEFLAKSELDIYIRAIGKGVAGNNLDLWCEVVSYRAKPTRKRELFAKPPVSPHLSFPGNCS